VEGERIHGTTRQRPLELFQQVEAPTLRPLPAQPFELVTWTQAKVAPDCHVQVKGVLYSIPHRHIGKTLAVRLSATTAEFYLDHALVKTHLRPTGRRQTDWDDYPADKARFYQHTPNWCRAKAAALGPEVAQAVEGLLAQHALHYLRQSQGIIGLADKYGPDRLNAACQRALAFGDPCYRTIQTILHKGLEGQLALPFHTTTSASAGAYLRGPEELCGCAPTHLTQEKQHG